VDRFYSPVVSNFGRCQNCNDCLNACPVKAITHNGRWPLFDRAKCAEYVLKEDECLECVLACKPMTVTMRIFVRDEKGTIFPLED
jgi:ferredoxin